MQVKEFPKLPAIRGRWAPIYIEPIMGSGERITVGIVAISDDGEYVARPVLNTKKINCAFGNNGLALIDCADISIKDLDKHLHAHRALENWASPMTGIELGKVRPFAVSNIENIVGLGAKLTAAFSGLDESVIEAVPSMVAIETRMDEILIDAVEETKAMVSDQAPNLAANFGVQVNIVNGGRKTKFDYYGAKYIANFSKLYPLEGTLNDARVKICTLASLRAGQVPLGRYELILFNGDRILPNLSKIQIKNFMETKIEIIEEAKLHKIETFTVSHASEASKRILSIEA